MRPKKPEKVMSSLHDIERRIRLLVEGRVESGGNRYDRDKQVFEAVFPRAKSKRDIGFDVFRSSLDSLGFDITKEQAKQLFQKYNSGKGDNKKLDFDAFRVNVLSEQQQQQTPSDDVPRTQLGRQLSRPKTSMSVRSRPGSQGGPWDRTSIDYGFNQQVGPRRSARNRPSSQQSGRSELLGTLGRKSTYVTDCSRPPPQVSRPTTPFQKANPYETTYEHYSRHVDPSRSSADQHADSQESYMWGLANGVLPRKDDDKAGQEHVSYPRSKTWVTHPLEIRPPKIDKRESRAQRRQRGAVCDFYSTKYTRDTSNVTSYTAPRSAKPRLSMSCVALASMGCFPDTMGANNMTELVRSVSKLPDSYQP